MAQNTKFMFVYQSNTMKKLSQKYAPHLILSDATYMTTKYALSLYFLFVKGNVIYTLDFIKMRNSLFIVGTEKGFENVSLWERNFKLKIFKLQNCTTSFNN